jgi:hypothetical protein
MYVCMYVCKDACTVMYVSTHACLCVVCTYVCMQKCMYWPISVCTYVYIRVRMYVCTHVCMYVCHARSTTGLWFLAGTEIFSQSGQTDFWATWASSSGSLCPGYIDWSAKLTTDVNLVTNCECTILWSYVCFTVVLTKVQVLFLHMTFIDGSKHSVVYTVDAHV